jgi:nucleoside-diphosphate-sugar epimerase
VVKANILAALKPEASGKIFNIASGRAYTVFELYEFIKNYFGSDLEPKFEPPRPGDVRHTLADISRAREVLGYTPEIDFEQGLLLTIKWFQDNFNVEEE